MKLNPHSRRRDMKFTPAKTVVDKQQDKKIAKLAKKVSVTKGLYAAGTQAAQATSAWSFFNLTRNIAQGDDAQNRDGNQIDVLSVKGHIDLIGGISTGVTNMPRLRVVLCSTKDNGVDPTFDNIFDLNNINAVYSQDKILNRFTSVYMDKILTLTDALEVANHTNITIRRLYFKKTFKNGHKATWITNGVNAASTGVGQLYLFVCNEDNYNVTTYPITMNANWNIVFNK